MSIAPMSVRPGANSLTGCVVLATADPQHTALTLLGVALFGRPSLTDVLERDFARTPQQAECLVDSDDDTENGSGAESLAVTNEAAR